MANRLDPFREFDRLAERLLSQTPGMAQSLKAMPVDLFRSGDHYVLQCDLPGIDPGSVDVGVDGRMLTIRAQRSVPSPDVEWLAQERPSGTFVRQLTLGSGLAMDQIQATYADGVLTLTLPVAEEAKPRRITVEHRGGAAEQQARQAVTTGTSAGSGQGSEERSSTS